MKQLILIFCLLLTLSTEAYAAFSLDVSPTRGGRDIRFQPVRYGHKYLLKNEDVTFTVTSDEAKQYRITQRLQGPLRNEKGETLPDGVIKMFSNTTVKSGAQLRVGVIRELTRGQQVLYTSNLAGEADTLVITFGIDLQKHVAAGHYTSQIVYTLEPAQGGVSTVTIVRNIYLEIISDFNVEIENERGGRTIDLGRINEQNPQGAALMQFRIRSNASAPYRVYQELTSPFMGERGGLFDPEQIHIRTSIQEGVGSPGVSGPMNNSRQLLFSSDAKGSSAAFNVVYESRDLSSLTAGNYRSTLRYYVDSNQLDQASRAQVMPIAIDVEPIFYLDIKTNSEQSAMDFGSFSNERTDSTQQTHLEIQNNLGLPYQITQRSTGSMRDEQGHEIPRENYTYYVSGPAEARKIMSSRTAVSRGDTVIFISDEVGSPADITINFELKVPPDQPKGSYSSDTTYTMSTL